MQTALNDEWLIYVGYNGIQPLLYIVTTAPTLEQKNCLNKAQGHHFLQIIAKVSSYGKTGVALADKKFDKKEKKI